MPEIQVYEGEGINRIMAGIADAVRHNPQLVTIGGDALDMGVTISNEPMGWKIELSRGFRNRNNPITRKLSDFLQKSMAPKSNGVADYKFDMQVGQETYRGCFVISEESASTKAGKQWVTYKIQADMRV